MTHIHGDGQTVSLPLIPDLCDGPARGWPMIAPVGVPGPPPSPERLAEQVATQGRSLDTARAGLHVPSAFPCGYCRLDSTCSVGDRCPWCGRCKAPLWWKTCVPTTATTTPSQPGRHSAPSSQLAPLRRNAVAIILVVIFVVCLGTAAVLLAVADTAHADGWTSVSPTHRDHLGPNHERPGAAAAQPVVNDAAHLDGSAKPEFPSTAFTLSRIAIIPGTTGPSQ